MTIDAQPTATDSTRTDLRFIIIGAGMSGILSAIKLQEAGIDNFTIYEKADRLGGTWRENTYAGIACDVPSHLYSYSFASNPEWSHRFSPGSEIQAYFEDIARRYGVYSRIQTGKEVTRCAFEDGRWKRRKVVATTPCISLNTKRSRSRSVKKSSHGFVGRRGGDRGVMTLED